MNAEQYLDKYISLMIMAQERREIEGVKEVHHIFPRSWMKNDYVVTLTLEEHLVSHYWLHKAFPKDWGMTYALNMMCNRIKIDDSNLEDMATLYAESKKNVSRVASAHMKTDAHPWRGKKRPDHSKKMKGNLHLKDHKHSEQTKEMMSSSKSGSKNHMHGRTGEKAPMFGRPNPGMEPKWQITCEHCGKTIQKSLFSRWHGDNCKLKSTQ